jgi:hypothetical protein
MLYYLESTVFCELKRVTYCRYSMTSVRITRNIFVNTLHADFNARAAVAQHFVQVGLQAIVGAGFYRNSNTLCAEQESRICIIKLGKTRQTRNSRTV